MPYAPPPGPPPPRVPDGWKAQFDDRYKEWFYVNLKTGISQWEAPPVPDAHPSNGDPTSRAPVAEPPPHYAPPVTQTAAPGEVHNNPATANLSDLGSNNPFNPMRTGSSYGSGPSSGTNEAVMDEDARVAARLQAEENGQAGMMGQGSLPPQPQPQPQSLPPPQPLIEERRKSPGGFLGKLMGKASSKTNYQGSGFSTAPYYPPPPQQPPPQQQQQQQYPPMPQYQQQPYPQQQQQQQQQYGGYYGPQPNTPSYPQYVPQQQQQQQHHKQHGRPRIGRGGAAALGLGGGLLGGALLSKAVGSYGRHAYEEGLADGADMDDYSDDGFGGDDFGGGDFGGDF
ncbi:hypothetical protein PABG_07293 [Paracoccidioides brasiliensis Pb03]|nr:hypothetical protein PABG_07293 [Paracoccidioides brasiliensis Pb03]